MGCGWKTVRGRRVRTGPVGAPVIAGSVAELSISAIFARLGISIAVGSPSFTAEELRQAVVRIWSDPEKGYFTEARFRPTSPPIVRPISQAEATRWEMERPTPADIAHAFVPIEVPSY